MEESSYYNSDLGLLRPSPEDAESQYYPDEFYDNTSIEPIEAYSIDPTSDRLFTNVLTEDPNAYTEQEHDPIWQPRGCHTMTIQEQYEEIDRRTAQIRKTIQLFHGNLILDCPIAPRLLKEIPHAQPPERDEFTHMRYSAVTCDPALFWEEKFTLRPLLFAKPRITELLIAVTMYNEDELLLGKTLKAVMKNLKYLYSLNSNAVWGNDAWKKVVVCIISDGRVKLNLKSQALLAGLGVYQDGIAKSQVHDKAVTAHLYEYTTQVRIEIAGDQVKVKPRGVFPCQILFCLKEKNQKKINSHRWFFQAFGRVLQPNICVLLEAGTVPVQHAFYNLWDTLRRNPTCGCAIGEYRTESRSSLLNPLVAMQHFEFKMKNLLDRPVESLFGHRFDIAGALSAYRYEALLNDRWGKGPLQEYLRADHYQTTSFVHTNMALAEDRILTFALVNKKNCSWKVLYVASAYAEIDVPTSLQEFIMQRRRWLNGNTVASLYALAHFMRLLGTAHSVLRKMALTVQFSYQALSMCLSWFHLGIFFLTFHIITLSLGDKALYGRTGYVLAQFFGVLYLVNLFFGFALALGNRPSGNPRLYLFLSYIWTVIMIYLIFAIITLVIKISKIKDNKVSTVFQTQLFWSLVIPILVTYAIWLIISVLFLSPWHMITSVIQYILFIPTSLNLISVYAFCNLHDVSWYVKQDDIVRLGNASLVGSGAVNIHAPEINLDEQYDAMLAQLGSRETKSRNYVAGFAEENLYRGSRTIIVFLWVLSNTILTATMINISNTNKIKFGPALQTTQGSVIFIAIAFWQIAGDASIKFAGAVVYLLLNLCWRK